MNTLNNLPMRPYRLTHDFPKDTETEKWKAVAGYEDYYLVSSLGRIFSTRTKSILITRKSKQGRIIIMFSINRKKIVLRISRLMAQAFIPNPDNLPLVRHLNDIRDDNRLENLAWGTDLDNSADAKRNNRYSTFKRGVTHHTYGKVGEESTTGIKVNQMDSMGNIIEVHGSMRQAAKATGVHPTGISLCCRGKSNFSGGFKWAYNIENK